MKFPNFATPRVLLLSLVSLLAASFFIYKVAAGPNDPAPIDFDNGPLVTQKTPSNLVLALSVEWPTTGEAYKDATYIDGQEYVGYFNSSRCYTYPGYGSTPRTTSTFDVNNDYFSPTGATNSRYQCNTSGAGTGFSGNYLNYASMTAPDILRLALTGGDRGIDTTDKTVLDRGTINYFPTDTTRSAAFKHRVAASLVPLVTPFNVNQDVIAHNCLDQIIFSTKDLGNAAAIGGCIAPNNADATDLRPIAITGSSVPATTTVTPTVPPFNQVGTVWVNTGAYTTTIPTGGPVESQTAYTTTMALTTTVPVAAAESPAVVRATSYVFAGTSTAVPPAGAESPAVVRGYISTTGVNTRTVPPPAAESPPVIRAWAINPGVFSMDYQSGFTPTVPVGTSAVAVNAWVCHDNTAPRIIRRGPGTDASTCPAGQTRFRFTTGATSPATRIMHQNYTPLYRGYTPFYNAYTATNRYYSYTSFLRYAVKVEVPVWSTYTSTTKSIVKPRVQVCDSVEGPTRTVVYGTATTDVYNYCTKYVSGGSTNYKPEGQIQQKSDSIRVAVTSYLLDDSSRDGAVLRAPMKYTGPNKYDTNGSLVTNNEKEWDATTGVFVVQAVNDSASTGYTQTGVISYLNRFNKSGNAKSKDHVGELWYESLRYLQGLAPSNGTTDSITIPPNTLTARLSDGFPVYKTWTDPLTSACQRSNYILGIGDTNTHWDRSLPGITTAEQDALNPAQIVDLESGGARGDRLYSTTPTIKGDSAALDAHDWTKIMDSFERGIAAPRAYTDSKGRAQTANGNPSPNTTLTNLDTSATGSSNRSSYHWAGLAYWANTQAIRKDTINNESMDKVRVKTFMIDVDENDRNVINADIKKTSFYLAGKYGYFDDTAEDGKPFVGTDESRWAETDGSPRGYVLASQPKRLIAGITKFFNEQAGGGGSFAAIAVSSNSFSASSPDGKTYAPSFIPGQWSGTIKSFPLTLNTTTNSLSAGTSVTWDAGAILTSASKEAGTVTLPKVKPDDRKIFTYIVAGSTPRGESFTYAATNNGADLPASFSQIPYSSPAVTDTLAEARINYIRGIRTKELDETLRPRESIMGDIINSGPVYKGVPNEKLTGEGYPEFFRTNKTRVPTVYVGSNDGMLHAFRADTGQELFGYIPGAVLGKLPNLTSKNYIHTAFVDAVPVVEEAKLSSGWKTVLASGMGGGAQGVFALDVTDPTAFGRTNVMFEFTDKDDPYMGNVTGQPQIVKIRDADSATLAYKYFMVVSSGYNNYKPDGTGTYITTSDQALFFLDLSKPTGSAWVEGTNYYKVILPATTGTITNGLAQPGIRYGSAGEGIEFFSGDLQGNIWKVSFGDGISAATVSKALYNGGSGVKPLFTAEDAGSNKQPITSSPVIYPSLFGGNMVIFGTGRLLESTDRNSTATQSIYGVWDSGQDNAASYGLKRNKLETLAMNSVTLTITGNTPTFANSTTSKRGWYFDLTRTNERVVIDAVAATGVININSTIPPSSICSDNGDGLKYFLSPSNGKDVLATEPEGGGYLGRSTIVDIDISTALDSSYTNRSVSGRRTATKREAILTQRQNKDGTITTTKNIDVTYLATGRTYWREVRDFNRTNP
jgi:type IV pilus assembly protein PilY1